MAVERASAERLRTFFLGMTRTSFSQLGIGDREIAEYVAGLLADFSRAERWALLRDAEGRALTGVVEMLLAELPAERRERAMSERALRKHVGDYTLFIAGLFRGYAERGGFFDYYLEEGKRSYHAVSALDLMLYRPGFLIFEELSRGFERYAGALDYMRRCFFADPGTNPLSGRLREWARKTLSNN